MGRKPKYDVEMTAASTRLPVDTYRFVELLAQAKESSVSEEIRVAVEEWARHQDIDAVIAAKQALALDTQRKLRELAFAGKQLK